MEPKDVFKAGYYWYRFMRERGYPMPIPQPMGAYCSERGYAMTNPVEDFKFDIEDVGLYIDGAFGLAHAVRRMAELVEPFDKDMADRLLSNLDESGELTEEGWENAHYDLEDATGVLQEHTEPGYVWYWEAGDLSLVPEEEL